MGIGHVNFWLHRPCSRGEHEDCICILFRVLLMNTTRLFTKLIFLPAQPTPSFLPFALPSNPCSICFRTFGLAQQNRLWQK